MNLYSKMVTHLRNGTLIERIRNKVSRLNKPKCNCCRLEVQVGDVYHGEMAENYLKKRLQQDYWHFEQEVVRNLLTELPDGISVLDIPFGTGRFVPYYLKKKMKVYGLDSSKDMLNIARRELKSHYGECNLQIGTAEKLPYETGMFDLVVCFRFLSHVVSFNQANAILRELSRVTNSRAILQLRARREDAPRVREPLAEEPINNRLRVGELTKLLDDFGFRVDKIKRLDEREAYVRSVFVCEKK